MQTTLDRIDFEILGSLQEDARLSNKELAARVGLAPSTCHERVRRLREAGVLLGAHERVHEAALGWGLQAIIAIRLRQHRRAAVESFREHLEGMGEVLRWYHVGGAHDFLVHVAVRDSQHLHDLALDGFTAHPEVDHMETHLCFALREHARPPCYAAEGHRFPPDPPGGRGLATPRS